jgi:hypothetical protein
MADFVDIPTGDQRSVETKRKRRAVKILMIGQPDDVEAEIAHLYHCGYCRVENWSRALPYTQIQEATVRQPGEIMRIYKRYVDR